MDNYTIAICDDDTAIVEAVGKIIKEINTDYNVCNFYNPSEIFSYMKSHNPGSVQIVIMDIEYDDCNGIEESNHLLSLYPDLKIILLTGHVEYVHNILDTDPISFVFKPVNRDELENSINRAIKMIQTHDRKTISLRVNRNYRNFYIDEIIYIESHLRYATLFFDDHSENCMRKLGEIEELLDDSFVRCHQSYIVNLRFISRLENNKILLKNDVIIPISRNRKTYVYDCFLKYYGDVII